MQFKNENEILIKKYEQENQELKSKILKLEDENKGLVLETWIFRWKKFKY